MRLCVPILVAALLLVASGEAAFAQDDKPDYEAARQHYKTATEALSQGDFAIAAREFGLAYQITKDPVLFYKIAESHDKAGDCESALIYYGRYLKEASPPDKDRAIAEEAVATCKQKLGQTDDGGDGGGDGGDGGGDGGDIIAPDLDDTPGGGDGDGQRQPTFLDEGTSWQRTAAWVSVGFAVAAGTTGAVLALSANSREEDINTLIDFRDPTTGQPREYTGEVRRQYEDFVDEGEDLKTYSQIAWIAAGAGAVAAVVFFVWDPGSPGGDRGETAYKPTITPVVTPDGAAVNAGWRF